jgi:spermidine/putrescine transport system substrate-binding protein
MSVAGRQLKLLCWEGYDAPEITGRYHSSSQMEINGSAFVCDREAVSTVASAAPGAWDLVNLNSPYGQSELFPAGLIAPLPADRFAEAGAVSLPFARSLAGRTLCAENREIIGVGQRFGPFNLVINSQRISMAMAADQGFGLALQKGGRFGILRFPDFNILHICISVGINPFQPLSAAELERFTEGARQWFNLADLISDDAHALNDALVRGDIDFYLSGGRFTAALARREGHLQVAAVTPDKGPIDGCGGIVFMEVTSVVTASRQRRQAEDFLAFTLEPENLHSLAINGCSCNPVVQMGDGRVLERFSTDDLAVLQWDTLEDELSRCVELDVPPDVGELNRRLAAVVDECAW